MRSSFPPVVRPLVRSAPRRHRLTPLAHAVAMAGLLAAPLGLQAQTLARGGLPGGLQVVQGQASVATQGGQMTVKNSAGAILNWQSFSIGAANGVHFQQANAASKVLNRVVGSDPSSILGNLTSNGQVWLLNPNGVLFGQGARVDVAGLVTGTLRLNDNDFLAGRYRFSAADGDSAGIRNDGAITSSFGGQIVLLAEHIENTGHISAPGGSVSLAAARSVELVDTGLPNLTVKVKVPAGEALNLGTLAAAGGTIDLYAGIVNQQGLVQADTLGTDRQGRITLHAADTLTLGAGSITRATGAEAGAAGGAVDLLGAQVGVLGQAVVDVSGAAAGGGIRLGGGLQGRDSSVPNARAVYFGPEAMLRADTNGDIGHGGRIVLWSNEATRAYGTLSARGGRVAGDGGFVETSGGWLDARPLRVDVSARGGRAGNWLLDPNDIYIVDAGPDANISGGPIFTSTDDNSVITTATLAAALNAGTSVTVATGTGGTNSQPGDVVFDDANLNVAPTAPVTFTVQAARDIVVRNSVISSTGQPLSLDFQAAGSGIGAIEILLSTVTTAGGNVTLGGTLLQQLPLPGGGFTAQAYRPAVGYSVLTGAPSSTSSGGNDAVAIYDSTLNLGSGNLRATGLTTVDNRDAVSIGTTTGTTVINAGRIDLVGYASVPSPVNTDVGVFVGGNGTDVTATVGIGIEGGGRIGVAIADGARVTLNAAAASGAAFSVVGYGSDDAGVGLLSDDFDLGTGGRGTRITVNNASFDVSGDSLSNYAVAMFNNNFVPGPLLDLSNATSATFIGLTGSFDSLSLNDVELKLVRNGATRFEGNATVSLNATALEGDGGSLSFSGGGQRLRNSTISSAGAALAIDFATTGASPTGVLLENTIINTAGGDVRFGALQLVSSPLLGSTTVAAPWVETVADNTNYNGPSQPGALWLLGSSIDAGNGRVYGGGAVRNAATNTGGVTLDGSVIDAREITLAGRSEREAGLNVVSGSYRATRVFTLDGLGGAEFFGGLYIAGGSTLQLDDPTASAGSRMSLSGRSAAPGPGVILTAGNAGSGNETLITVNGAALLIDGSTVGDSAGLSASGQSDLPGGLLINALGATSVSINASNGSTTGAALTMAYMNLLGPQNSASSPLNITASGGRLNGTPSTELTGITLSSAGPVSLLTDGLQVTDSQLSGDAGLALRTDTSASGRAAAPIGISGSTLEAGGAGAQLRIEGSAGDAVRGEGDFNAGQGLTLADSTLRAGGAGGGLVLNARGSDGGGTGVRVGGSLLSAANLNITGRGVIDGSGIVVDEAAPTATVITATNLSLAGQSADTAFNPVHLGVQVGGGNQISLLPGRGNANLSGDSVLLGTSGSAQLLLVGGDAASFEVNTAGSMLLVGTTFDFLTNGTAGGTAVTLRADTDSNLSGRVRMQNTSITTGGADLTVTGGTGAAVGVHSFDPSGNPAPFNTTLLEGASGVLLAGSNLLSTGSGVVSISGRAASDGRADLPTAGGAWGVQGTGTLTVVGGNISVAGDGGDKGTGIDVGVGTPGAVFNLQGNTISLSGRGVGLDPGTGLPYAGVAMAAGSTLNALGSAAINITGTASPVALTGLGATSAGPITLLAGGALTLATSAFTAAGDFSATATGATANGSLLSLIGTNVTAGGALTMTATATTPGAALSLLSGVSLTGASVGLSGTASGAPSNAPGISAVAPSGSITATSGTLSLNGRNPALDTEGILLEGVWALQAPNVIDIVSDGTTLLRSPVGFSGSPSFSASQAVNLTLNSPFGITLGGAASALDAGTLATALAGLPATATFTLTVPDPSGLSVAAAFSLPARLQLRAEQIDFTPTGSLTSSAAGDAIVLDGLGASALQGFDNLAGPGALAAPNGRWVLQLQDPTTVNLGGLGGDFTAYNLAALPWAVDASGNLITPAAGNAIGFAVAPAALAGTALAGLLDKVYDAGTSITLDPLAWAISGLLTGDTLTLAGATTATLADKNVGSGKAVTLNPASLFTIVDGNGNPVFGYEVPVFSANVTPATLVLGGTVAANKVYDAGTVATLANAGSITPLAGDVVGLGAANASFADKNVGTAKAVTLAGVALTGADAGNYTLQLPSGLTADITPLALPVTGLTVNSKVYDATTLATLNGSAAVGALAGDSVLLAGSASASFADKNVGTAKPV
ncbi:MAG: YDG domain-containing protein, partial [Rubrivivax sp.]|nr:YDG domain-containing protein [Rubrivivax sp.]